MVFEDLHDVREATTAVAKAKRQRQALRERGRLFVGNVSYEATEQEIASLFEAAGAPLMSASAICPGPPLAAARATCKPAVLRRFRKRGTAALAIWPRTMSDELAPLEELERIILVLRGLHVILDEIWRGSTAWRCVPSRKR